ncbi:hypothetical protein [Asticcacaulis endophyticus]|uniref:Uncharacterized protein n=1 Tax=Asticcacaulis endophyticus TaxID=1395890 RepID=A0A918PTS2_9CAUL|nr:hypothetical protein [Asticcacaulis endophyticus]GGZ21716.1 hypothetical protein GCM10011273_03120 [Asticcacaulis endophyticus]
MSGDLYAVAGKRFYLGPAIALKAANYIYSELASLTYTEVDGWETHGAIGDTAQVITTSLINRARDTKQKGTKNAGSMENNFAYVPGDAGQALLDAAVASNSNYAVKILGNDEPAARSAAVTISNASPAVVSFALHGLTEGAAFDLATTGSLPTGLLPATTYYVEEVLTNGTFTLSATKGGAAINTTGAGSGTHTLTTEPAPSERYFVGLIMSNSETGGNANTVQMLSVNVEINSNIVKQVPLG